MTSFSAFPGAPASSSVPASAAASSSAAVLGASTGPRFSTFKVTNYRAYTKSKVVTLGWSCDGKWLAAGGEPVCKVWNMEKQKDPIDLKGHTEVIEQLVWDPVRPDVLLTTSRDKTFRVWDMRTEKSVSLTTEYENIYVTCSPDGNTVALGNFDNVINFVDLRKMAFSGQVRFPTDANEMSWNPAGDLFFLAMGEGTVSVLDYPSLKESYTINAHTGTCSCIKFDPKRRYFATGSADTLVALWDIDEFICVRTFGRLNWPIRAIGFSFDGEFIAAGSEDDFLDISFVQTGESAFQVPVKGALNCLAWHPTKHVLAYAGDESSTDLGVLRVFS